MPYFCKVHVLTSRIAILLWKKVLRLEWPLHLDNT